MNNSSAHCFALYSAEQLVSASQGQTLNIRNQDLWMRIVKILRLRADEQVILFDAQFSVRLLLHQQTFQSKSVIVGTVLEFRQHVPLFPSITLCVGLLKKEALEEVIYSATVLGVTSIIPVITKKIQRAWGGPKELERLLKIMIAAAEQSKQFVFPQLKEPILFDQFLNRCDNDVTKSKNIYFDFHETNALDVLNDLAQKRPESITIFCGSEGGLTEEEIALLKLNHFSGIALSPTVLRSTEAVTVGLGIFRSCLRF